jgi:hypothetical protein
VFSTITIAAFGTVALSLALALAWAVLHNMKRGETLRREMLQRLHDVPLRQALGSFQVDPLTYLYSERLVDIERHLRNCAACTDQRHCARHLQEGGPEHKLAFCPNYQELRSCQRRYGVSAAA